MKDYKCIYCGREIKNAGSLAVHQKECALNPNRIIIPRKSNWNSKGRKPWNKGLTKDSDERVKKHSQSIKKAFKTNGHNWSGKHLSKQHKQKISRSMKERFKNNPKVKPFGGCRGKMSSYEHWFCQKVVNVYRLAQKYDIINQYYQYPYFLDFAFLNIKVDVQIDGQFHQNQDMLISDQVRQKQLISRGWIVYHISYKDIKWNEVETIQNFLEFLRCINNVSQKILENQIVLYRKYKRGRIKLNLK